MFIQPFLKTYKWKNRDRDFSMPQTGGSDMLWIYLSWDETCVHTLSTASANRFNALLYWRVIKKSQKQQRVWRESQTLGAFCPVLDVWNLNPQLRPSLREESGFGLWRVIGCIWIPSHCVFGESLLQVTLLPQLTTSSETACHDPRDPHDSYHQTASTRPQRRWSNGWTQSKAL